jgi:DNA-directed RNA polymerase subunit RPC12/RpoP
VPSKCYSSACSELSVMGCIMVQMAVKVLTYLVSAVLVFLGLIFMISVNLGAINFVIGLTFVIFAVLFLFAVKERKPIEIKQTVTVTGPVKTVGIRCPNCGAYIDPMKAQVIDGKPYVTCGHCGNKFELSEEPTW